MLNKKRKSFILYNNYYTQIEMLTIPQRGELLTAIYRYVLFDSVAEDMSPIVSMAFSFIKDTLERDNEAYEEKCKKNAENAKKARKAKKDMYVSNSERNFSSAKKADNDIDIEIDIDNDIDIDKDKDKDMDMDIKHASASFVSDADAPRISEDDKKYLQEKGIPREYIDERSQRAEAYAKDSGEDAVDVIRKWWQKDRSAPQWNAKVRYTGRRETHSPRAQEMEDWFEERLRDAFGDDAV